MKLAFGEREGEKTCQRKTERESIGRRDQTKIAQIKIEILMNESLNSHAVVSLLLFLNFSYKWNLYLILSKNVIWCPTQIYQLTNLIMVVITKEKQATVTICSINVNKWHFIRIHNISIHANKINWLPDATFLVVIHNLSLIHIWRCRRYAVCRSRWSPYH